MKKATITLSVVLASHLMADTVKLTEVTVSSASGFEQKITDAPASISVVTNEELQQKKYANLAEALEDVEGIDVRAGNGKTGGLNISIRGMGTENTLILIDGRRQSTGGNITPNGFGETANNFLPPLSAIERIEVIRGPMSTLYGSDAMGGVINIITKKVGDEWSGSIDINQSLSQHSGFGNSRNISGYMSGPIIKDKLGIAVRGSLYNREASDLVYNDGEEVSKRGDSPVEGQNYSLGMKLTLTAIEDNDFWIDAFTSRQSYNNDKAQLGTLDTSTRANGYKDRLRFHKDQFTLGHEGRFEFGKIESSILKSKTKTIGRTVPGTPGVATAPGPIAGTDRKLESDELVFDTKLITELGESNTLSVGGQFIKSEMTDGMVTQKFKQDMWSLFAEDEYRVTDDFSLTFGARYEYNKRYGSHVSPRLYAVYALNQNWTVKGGVSTGYKTPRINDLHDGINGATSQGKTLTIGSPHLKPEKSVNYEAGVYYDHGNGFNANATLFHNVYKDKIETDGNVIIKDNPDIPDGTYSQKRNVGRANISGLELAFKIPVVEKVWFNTNYTYMKGERKEGPNVGMPLTSTPKHSINATLNYQTTNKLRTWVKGEYRSKRARFTSTPCPHATQLSHPAHLHLATSRINTWPPHA